jgi:hypothetical protein
MVDDSIYIIVPNFIDESEIADGSFSNHAGDKVAELMKDGYRIINKNTTKDSVHYVLMKFKTDPNAPKSRIPGSLDGIRRYSDPDTE